MRSMGLSLLAAVVSLILGCSQSTSTDVVRVAVSPASPPNLYEDNGEIVGLDRDIFEGYCAARNCTLQITTYDWQGMLDAVVNDRADVAFSGISITEARKEVMDFSIPYMENTWNLVSMQDRGIEFRDNLGEMKQYSVGYPQGMAYTDFITNELQPQGVYSLDLVKLYPTYNEVMADLQRGDLDLAFLDGTVAAFYRKTLPIQDSYVFTGTDRFGFAFPKNSSLRDDFDNYLTNELGDQGLQIIIDKWMN